MTFLAQLPAAIDVIPHRGDALLIDDIVAMDGSRLEAQLQVRAGTAFSAADGSLPGWTAPEIMAQGVAAFGGCRSLQERGVAMPLGLLLGVRHLQLDVDRIRVGEVVRVVIRCTSSDEEGRGVFDCELLGAAGTLAAATLTAFQPQNAEMLRAVLEDA